jgi:benzylsuccinate CoA-transferase BbsE subunit
MPGAPYMFSATPWALRRPAPKLGEHTAEVLAEITPASAPSEG